MTAPISASAEPGVARNGIALVLVALLLTPFSLMLFMGRGRLALFYAGLQLLWLVAALFIVRTFSAPLARAGFAIDTVFAVILLGLPLLR